MQNVLRIFLKTVDGTSIWANLLIPLEAGTPLIKEFVLRTFGTANWTQFCPGKRNGNVIFVGREIEFFCGLECARMLVL